MGSILKRGLIEFVGDDVIWVEVGVFFVKRNDSTLRVFLARGATNL